MKPMTCVLLPQLPSPPNHLIDQINRQYRPEDHIFSPQSLSHVEIQKLTDWRKQNYEWIQPMASNKNKRFRFDGHFLKWIQENITEEFHQANSGVMFFDESQLPHTDLTRDFVLLYNIESGGPDAKLCFWQEQGKTIYRDRMQTAERGTHLKLIEEFSGPSGVWYLMNTRILHSVENMQSLRMNLQVSFDEILPQKFLNFISKEEIYGKL